MMVTDIHGQPWALQRSFPDRGDFGKGKPFSPIVPPFRLLGQYLQRCHLHVTLTECRSMSSMLIF